MQIITNSDWANAIALRLSDEWFGKEDFPEDAHVLRRILADLLTKSPMMCERLIGTGIIEEDYFEELG
ncbi:hypothetical protein EPN96_07510 [bacterium]|nr:MAG: hypothetical protein EPN96_07510 [bacterium]